MIRVGLQPEYPRFDSEVRQPGNAFLSECPAPTSSQFKRKNYWSRCAAELREAYSGICAYTSIYLIDKGSVDHYRPKVAYPELAYEWSNYRLASSRVNSSKGDNTNVLDPFEVEDDWFVLDIPSCLVKHGENICTDTKASVNNTINTLGLNRDDYYVQERCDIIMCYAREEVALNFLQRRYPFIAKELSRQQLDPGQLRSIFRIQNAD